MSSMSAVEAAKAALSKPGRPNAVKNKMPAAVQITAEQILREAKERSFEPTFKQPVQKIADKGELEEYRRTKRKMFEDAVRRNRASVTWWLKYADFEESQMELERARSVYERALDANYRVPTVWIKYAEMEMKQKNINHARNVWDRAVRALPRVDQFWYKYVYMEETLGNVPAARQVFERWMLWEPDEKAWMSYINMEKRYEEIDRCRDVFRRFVVVHPDVKSWLKWAKFEERQDLNMSRAVYEQAMQALGDELADPTLYIAFAKFEEKCREYDRARVIYKYALDHVPKSEAQELYQLYTQFEKQFGYRDSIEDVILNKRRFQYEEELAENRRNYDTWFNYIRLEESNGDLERIRDIYEQAIAETPPAEEKRLWRRYIYLWINYALFEELDAQDINRTREVYKAALENVPHKKFTFAKVWLLYAQFEIRQKNVDAARKALGVAIGKCPKDKLFKGYIELEMNLREFDRCRELYQKFLTYAPQNVYAWIKYAELEKMLGEVERCRGILKLGVEQPLLDMPELLWKAFIDFEYGEEEYDNTRNLYEQLLERTQHVKVWISYAEMEVDIASDITPENEEPDFSRVRKVFERAEDFFKGNDSNEERATLLEAWRDFEMKYGTEETREEITKRMPRKLKKRRKIETLEGMEAGWEEYIDYIFPTGDTGAQPNLKLLAMAQKWKKQQTERQQLQQQPHQQEEQEPSSSTT